MRRGLLALLVVLAGAGLWTVAGPAAGQESQRKLPTGRTPPSQLRAAGGSIFADGCSSCHRMDARGIAHRGPSLRGVGAAAVDWYVSSGRMPLSRPGIQPARGDPVYSRSQVDALIAYLTTLPTAGGPVAPRPGGDIPDVDPARGDVQAGQRLFADSCSGCHQIMTKGGIGTGFYAPPLDSKDITPKTIGEAIRIGPYLMPRFSQAQITPSDVDDIARYVQQVGQSAPDRGGWGIGNIGPIPEGLVAFLVALLGLMVVARVIGERA